MYFDDEKFWEQERQQRELTELAAMEGKVAGMRKTGTKKRKKGKLDGDEDVGDEDDTDSDVDSDDGQSKVKKRKASTPASEDVPREKRARTEEMEVDSVISAERTCSSYWPSYASTVRSFSHE